jgi:hypothetical protein
MMETTVLTSFPVDAAVVQWNFELQKFAIVHEETEDQLL